MVQYTFYLFRSFCVPNYSSDLYQNDINLFLNLFLISRKYQQDPYNNHNYILYFGIDTSVEREYTFYS